MAVILCWVQEHALLMFAIAIVICNFLWLLLCRKKINIRWPEALLIAILHDIIGYSAMRLLAIIEVGGDLSKAANMRLFGAIFVLPVFYLIVAKRKKINASTMMDIAAICVVIGLIFGRFDCLVGGCCYGNLLPGNTGLRWPIREIELVYYAVFMTIYCPKVFHSKAHGEVYPIFMASYGTLRFILEWVRIEYTTQLGLFRLAHIWALVSIGLGLSVYFEIQSQFTRKHRR